MTFKRVLGIIILICGVLLIVGSNYITNQVKAGKIKVSGAQKQVDQTNSLFSLNPVAKEIGQGFTGQAQKKINSGKEEIAHYEEVAAWVQIGGIGFIIIGLGVIFIGNNKSSRKR